MTPQEQLNHAIWYALRHGCFFPVPEPARDASVEAWIRWGAMRYLHTAIAGFDDWPALQPADPPAPPQAP